MKAVYPITVFNTYMFHLCNVCFSVLNSNITQEPNYTEINITR